MSRRAIKGHRNNASATMKIETIHTATCYHEPNDAVRVETMESKSGVELVVINSSVNVHLNKKRLEALLVDLQGALARMIDVDDLDEERDNVNDYR